MPDAHLWLGSTIGSVIPTDGAIIAAAVGVDIGCGMIATDTGLVAGQLARQWLAAGWRAEQVDFGRSWSSRSWGVSNSSRRASASATLPTRTG